MPPLPFPYNCHQSQPEERALPGDGHLYPQKFTFGCCYQYCSGKDSLGQGSSVEATRDHFTGWGSAFTPLHRAQYLVSTESLFSNIRLRKTHCFSKHSLLY